MEEGLLRSLVWTDYRLALLFTVIIPIILLIWAFVQRAEFIQRLLIIYWRVSSLFAITIYILIAAWPIGFATGFFARLLIPIALWFWADLNEEIDDQPPRPLKLAVTSWRWAITIYSTLGALFALPFLRCAFVERAIQTPSCRIWIEPSLLFKQYIHPASRPEFLGFLGMTGLFIYVICLSYFILVRLGRQGRSAIQQ
ncbi:MAG: DUF3177 family protein [Kastovskya adunca ATA6-11-RM4]|jgi:hypothetical protein|nr:DUF3177 family protein [Kastovskya adunca ATA6-11-RM4]